MHGRVLVGGMARRTRKRGAEMIVQHATLRRNLESIRRRGLLTQFSRGRLKAVWLHTRAREPWACGHCVLRHGGRIEDVVVLLVDVPRSQLKRHAGLRGVYYLPADVPPGRIVGSVSFQQVFASEVPNA